MALTSTERSLCNSLVQRFDPLISPVRNTKQDYRRTVADFQSQLRGTAWSPQQDVINGISDLQTQTSNELPGDSLEDMARIKHFMDNCLFFSGLQPVAVVLGGVLGIFGKIDEFIENISVTVPEIGLGAIADGINRILSGETVPGGSNISGILNQSDILTNCVSQLCGSEYNPQIIYMADTTDGLYDDFNVTKNPLDLNYGKFDYDTIYNNIGLTTQQKTNISLSIDGITQVKNGSITAISNAVNSVKRLIRSGGFF